MKNIRIIPVHFKLCFLIIIFSAVTAQARVPEFLFIPIENTGQNANSEYIGKSVSDELRNQINENFAVHEIPDSAWRSIARENQFIYEDEYSTRSVALQLGIILKRDVVLLGGYSVETSKSGGTDVVVFNIYLMSIRDRKIISHINFKTPADATLFTKMIELRDRVIAELAKVLPNKKDAERLYYEDESVYFKNQFVLSGGTCFTIVPAPVDKIPATGEVAYNPGDFPLSPEITLQYRRLNVFFDGFQVHASAGFSFGSTDVDMVTSSNSVTVDHYAGAFNIGPGYRLPLFGRSYLCIQGGVGYYYAKTIMDLGMSGKDVTDVYTGESIEEIKMDIYGPTARGDLILGYSIFGNLAIEIGGAYRVYFGTEDMSQQALAYGGVVLGF